MLIVPRDSVVDFLIQYAHVPADLSGRYRPQTWGLQTRGVEGFVEYLAARVSELKHRDYLLPVKELCIRVWEFDEAKSLAVLPDSAVGALLKAFLRAQDWEFFELAVSRLGGPAPLSFFTWVSQCVKKGTLLVPSIEKGYVRPVGTLKELLIDSFEVCRPLSSPPPQLL